MVSVAVRDLAAIIVDYLVSSYDGVYVRCVIHCHIF